MNEEDEIKRDIYRKIEELFNLRSNLESGSLEKTILTGSAVFDHNEVNAILDSLLEGWLGLGKRGAQFEKTFANILSRKYSVLTNSGSSASLLALEGIKKTYKLNEGEIITPACTFPTTFNPIIQLGFTPAIVDVDKSLNVSPDSIKNAIRKNTVGVFLPHTLGNPAEIEEIAYICKENGLFLIEDCCDALGSKYDGKHCGSFGDVSTHSFYPAHLITLAGEGGAITTDNPLIFKTVRRLRDWGRDCWCNTDEKSLDGACGKRFEHQVDGLSYDHKYIFSQIGYNMKPIELQAAMGLEQLKRMDIFSEIRKMNFEIYIDELKGLEEYLEFPHVNEKAEPVFFGFPIILKEGNRKDIVEYLNSNKIATRFLFSGNILKQPAYKDINYSKYEDLTNSDNLMKNCFWLGNHPSMGKDEIKYIAEKIKKYFK